MDNTLTCCKLPHNIYHMTVATQEAMNLWQSNSQLRLCSIVDPVYRVRASEGKLGLGNRYNTRIGKRKSLAWLIRIVFGAEYFWVFDLQSWNTSDLSEVRIAKWSLYISAKCKGAGLIFLLVNFFFTWCSHRHFPYRIKTFLHHRWLNAVIQHLITLVSS